MRRCAVETESAGWIKWGWVSMVGWQVVPKACGTGPRRRAAHPSHRIASQAAHTHAEVEVAPNVNPIRFLFLRFDADGGVDAGADDMALRAPISTARSQGSVPTPTRELQLPMTSLKTRSDKGNPGTKSRHVSAAACLGGAHPRGVDRGLRHGSYKSDVHGKPESLRCMFPCSELRRYRRRQTISGP